MNRRLWSSVCSFGLVLALLVCAAQPVLAEAPPPPGDPGGAPAPVSAPQGEPEKGETEAKEENAPAEADSIAPAGAEAVVDFSQWVSPPMIETGGVGPATTAAFVSDEQMLDAGGVLRAQGETLAALFAVGAIACPPGKVPTVYNGTSDIGCTMYYRLGIDTGNSIQSAHNDVLTKAGWWIWVSPNYNNPGWGSSLSKSVLVKGDTLGTTVTGGLGLNAPNITLRDLVVQNGPITAAGQSGTLRLHGVSVSGTFVDQYGINISGHKGSIYLTNVSATIGTGKGAHLDTTGGSGTVTVLNSAFDNNPNGHGLHIQANNAVKVENVSAAGNGKAASSGSGLYIEYRTRLTLKNIYAYDNYHWGIYAFDTTPPTSPGGPVTLNNITASENDVWEGIRLEDPGTVSGSNLNLTGNAWDDGIGIYDGRGAVTLSGVNASGNDFFGVNIQTNVGSVSLTNLRAAGNHLSGAAILSKGAVTVKNSLFYKNTGGINYPGLSIDNAAAAAPLGVTLTNLNLAENTGHGILVNSKGTLTLSGISVRGNGQAGAHLTTSAGGVTVSSTYGANFFNENGVAASCGTTHDDLCTGLFIDAKSAVSLSGVTADGNNYNGITIRNASSARISASTTNNNYWNGVLVSIKGGIVLDRVSALHNHGYDGILLSNTAGTGSPAVTLSHVLADHNGWGLEIYGRGPVTLNHVSASYNPSLGLYVSNLAGTSGVTLSNSLGADLISHNTASNLTIYSKGAISVRGVNASGSLTSRGAYIDNITSPTSAGVSVWSSEFNGNGDGTEDYGLQVVSKGSILLNTVNASNNQGLGADLQNQAATLAGKTVSVSKGTFSDNGDTGLKITSKGAVTLNNVTANGTKAGYGAYIENYQGGAGTGNVTIASSLGRNQFSRNWRTGVWIRTGGSVSVSNTEASRNGLGGGFSGIAINSYGTARTAAFTCVSAVNNNSYGIAIFINAGSMKPTLRGVWLGGNGAGGTNYTDPITIYYAVTCP